MGRQEGAASMGIRQYTGEVIRFRVTAKGTVSE